mmetsp:Transcript_22607/g.22455  ORF Transcript_22607/g.22455 Transcript_22607/m.22455 type:complete len:87 (-) Transcript_22607:1723-1983(-)
MKYIKIFCWIVIVMCLLIAVSSYQLDGEMSQEDISKGLYALIFALLTFGVLVVLEYKPLYTLYAVPILIGTVMFMAVDVTLQSKEF